MKQEKHVPSLVIYLTEDKKCFQIVNPSAKFDGNWSLLIAAIIGSHGMNKHYGSKIL